MIRIKEGEASCGPCMSYQTQGAPPFVEINMEDEKKSELSTVKKTSKVRIKTKDDEKQKKLKKCIKTKKSSKTKKPSDKSVVVTLQLDVPQNYIDEPTNIQTLPIPCSEISHKQLILTDSTTGESNIAVKIHDEIKDQKDTQDDKTKENINDPKNSFDSMQNMKNNNSSFSEIEVRKNEKPTKLDPNCQQATYYILKPTGLDTEKEQKKRLDNTSPERCNFQYSTFVHNPQNDNLLNSENSTSMISKIAKPEAPQPPPAKFDRQSSFYQSYRQVPEKLLISPGPEPTKPINRASGICHQSCLQSMQPCIHQTNPEKPLSQHDQFHADYFHRLTGVNDPLLQSLISEGSNADNRLRTVDSQKTEK